MGISVTGNNEIRLLTFMFTTITIGVIVIKQNKQSKMEHK